MQLIIWNEIGFNSLDICKYLPICLKTDRVVLVNMWLFWWWWAALNSCTFLELCLKKQHWNTTKKKTALMCTTLHRRIPFSTLQILHLHYRQKNTPIHRYQLPKCLLQLSSRLNWHRTEFHDGRASQSKYLSHYCHLVNDRTNTRWNWPSKFQP